MDKLVVRVVRVDREGGGTRPQIPLLEEIHGSVVVDYDPHTDVELALPDQERSLDVLLDDKAVVLELELACLWLLSLLLFFGLRRGEYRLDIKRLF